MKRLVAWLAGGGGVVLAIVAGIWIVREWGAYMDRQDTNAQAIRNEMPATRERTDSIIKTMASLGALIRKHQAVADTHKVVRESILAVHPIETAPAACGPWTLALTECQKESVALRKALGVADSAVDVAGRTIFEQRQSLVGADRALKKVDGRWILGLPCRLVVVGGGTSTAKLWPPTAQITAGSPILGKGRC